MTVLVGSAGLDVQPSACSRLLVTRQDADTRRYDALGFLSQDEKYRYHFAYLRSAVAQPGFRPLPGLVDPFRKYESAYLFPIFAERVMSSRRPDVRTSLDALGLGLDAAPMEVLARSGGRRVGDTIELVPAPDRGPDGSISVDFLVHGVRHMPPAAQSRITDLQAGDVLRMVPEPNNPVDERALLVTDRGQVPLGYVPNPLLEVIHSIDGPVVRVLRANGPHVGFHLRLLVQAAGRTRHGTPPFSGPNWETISES